ncbi:MAG: hypothetical protein GC137_08495 [Alphaproteobacteria bacterium]|nr:hypothetical protein [Alphaproteobacteria bacterium]
MTLLIIFLICVFVTLAIGALAGMSDIKTLTIPNNYSLIVIGAFCMAYAALYIGGKHEVVFSSIWSHLISAGVAFLVTFVLFALKIIGAGDSKFATACALWISAKYIPVYLFFMTLAGGVLGAFALYVKRKKPFAAPAEGGWLHQVQNGVDKVPYGVAISFGMLLAFIHAEYFSSNVLSVFLVGNPAGQGS